MNRAAKTLLCVGVLIIGSVWLLHSQPLLLTNRTVKLTGINIAGAEFNGDVVPGMYGQHYFYPRPSTIDYYATRGMNVIRLPVLWERLQRQLHTRLNDTEMARIDFVINHATAKKMTVILDVHNYAKYSNALIGSSNLPAQAFGDLWGQIALRYKRNPLVMFGLMNEPHDISTETWLEAVNIAIAEIRHAGAHNLILVPGNSWTSARDWTSTHYGTPNGVAMLKVVDPGKNNVIEVHQYFDSDYSGSHPECQNVNIGVESLVKFTQWARTHRRTAFLGEFGAGDDPVCLEVLDRVLKFLAENSDVWLGWTYWPIGAWWPRDHSTGDEPRDNQDPPPQMSVLEKYTRYVASPQTRPQ